MSEADDLMRTVHRAAVKAATDRLLSVLRSEFPIANVAYDALLSAFICIADAEHGHAPGAHRLEMCARDLRSIGAGTVPEHVETTGDVPIAHQVH